MFASLGRSRFVALLGTGPNPTGAGGRPARETERLMEALGRLGIECSLVLPGTDPSGDGLIDVTGDFRRLYGARGEFFYLMRPDGYVGLFQRPIDAYALQAYMAKLFEADAVAAAFAGRDAKIPAKAG